MNKRKLGQTDLVVSESGFGGLAIGGKLRGRSYGPVNESESREAIRTALRCGCNFFNTADVFGYGKSEQLIGEETAHCRKEVVLCTHAGDDFYSGFEQKNFSPEYIRRALEQSLNRLKTDYIDIYLLNFPSFAMISNGGIFEVLNNLKSVGLIRYGGVAVRSVDEMRAAITHEAVEVIEIPYSLLNPSMARIFPAARAAGCGIIAREPLYHGFLSGKYPRQPRFDRNDLRALWPQNEHSRIYDHVSRLKELLCHGERNLIHAAIRFVLEQQVISSAVTGCKTALHVHENCAAANQPALTGHELWVISDYLAAKQ
jgi:aryl-alcohol dehydrogenase-like predicted oxidoreductase